MSFLLIAIRLRSVQFQDYEALDCQPTTATTNYNYNKTK